MNSKVGSLEEKVKLPPTETISRCYQPQGNRKVIRILTVAVYVLCVSLAAIMLSLYYIFIWDPSIRPFATKPNNCDKVVIPEKIAIRLLNTSEVTAEQFYKSILEQYRILNHMQQQRQQFLQKQHLQLQQLSNTNRFQEVFATATIIQANRNNDPFNNNRKTTPIRNGTLLLETRPATSSFTVDEQQLLLQQEPQHMAPILDTTTTHIKRKPHRKHFNHHRHNVRKSYRKSQNTNTNPNIDNNNNPDVTEQQQQRYIENTEIIEPATSVMEPISYTPMPIPLILNTREEKRPHHHERSAKMSALQTRRRTSASAGAPIYERPTYMNPFLTGELIFEK